MGGFADFKLNPGLQTMLSMAGWKGGFSAADREALKRSMVTIRNAMVQPVGVTAEAKRRNAAYVDDAEWNVAVMTALASALALVLSGKLDELELD